MNVARTRPIWPLASHPCPCWALSSCLHHVSLSRAFSETLEGRRCWNVHIHIPRTSLQPMTDGSWCTKTQPWPAYSTPSPGFPSELELEPLPMVTLITHHLWPAFPSISHSPPLSLLPRITSQINYLHSDSCLRVCFWRNPNTDLPKAHFTRSAGQTHHIRAIKSPNKVWRCLLILYSNNFWVYHRPPISLLSRAALLHLPFSFS